MNLSLEASDPKETRLALPFISVVIPCRNEENYLAQCLDSIIGSDYPKDRMEVLIAEGRSEDGSRAIADRYARSYDYIQVLDNPGRILAAAWNVGIRHAKGDFIFSLNAHASFGHDFFSRIIRYHQLYPADCIGPVILTRPQTKTLFGEAVAVVLSHPFGVGNSRFRTGVDKPQLVDTCHAGAYRREVYSRVGLFNEKLVRSQDLEFNSRLKADGGKILLVPDVKIYYYTRSDAGEFFKYAFKNGYWTTYPYCLGFLVAKVRHLVPMFFVAALIAGGLLSLWRPVFAIPLGIVAGVYAACLALISAHAAAVRREARFLGLLPAVFFLHHLLYGLGSLIGMLQALVSRKFWASSIRRALPKRKPEFAG